MGDHEKWPWVHGYTPGLRWFRQWVHVLTIYSFAIGERWLAFRHGVRGRYWIVGITILSRLRACLTTLALQRDDSARKEKDKTCSNTSERKQYMHGGLILRASCWKNANDSSCSWYLVAQAQKKHDVRMFCFSMENISMVAARPSGRPLEFCAGVDRKSASILSYYVRYVIGQLRYTTKQTAEWQKVLWIVIINIIKVQRSLTWQANDLTTWGLLVHVWSSSKKPSLRCVQTAENGLIDYRATLEERGTYNERVQPPRTEFLTRMPRIIKFERDGPARTFELWLTYILWHQGANAAIHLQIF